MVFSSEIEKKTVYQLKGQAPKNKGRMNFKENCDLTKKYIYLMTPVQLAFFSSLHFLIVAIFEPIYKEETLNRYRDF